MTFSHRMEGWVGLWAYWRISATMAVGVAMFTLILHPP